MWAVEINRLFYNISGEGQRRKVAALFCKVITEMEIRLTVRAIIRWEQMTGRSFRDIDFSDAEDVRKAQYCAWSTYSTAPCPYREFLLMMKNGRLARKLDRSFMRYNKFVSQFVEQPKDGGASSAEPERPMRIGQIAAHFIASGMDSRFVLDEMLVGDIPLYAEALEDKMKQQEESRRLWTFYSIMPHVDVRKLRSPQQLCRFPWERQGMTDTEREQAINEFKDIMAGKIH